MARRVKGSLERFGLASRNAEEQGNVSCRASFFLFTDKDYDENGTEDVQEGNR